MTTRWHECVVIIMVVLVDQVSKMLAESKEMVMMNEGGVFGLLPHWGWLLVLPVILLVVLISWWRSNDVFIRGALVLIIGGGISNLIDRFVYGGVRDFIYYPGLAVYGNVADIFLAVGLVLIVWYQYTLRKSDEA